MILVAVLLFKAFTAKNFFMRPLDTIPCAVCSKAALLCCRQCPLWRRCQ